MWLCREAAPQGVGPVPGVADGLLPCPRGGGYRGGICGPWSTRGTGVNVQPITGVNTSRDKSKLWPSTVSGIHSNCAFLFGLNYESFSLKVDFVQRQAVFCCSQNFNWSESGILFGSTTRDMPDDLVEMWANTCAQTKWPVIRHGTSYHFKLVNSSDPTVKCVSIVNNILSSSFISLLLVSSLFICARSRPCPTFIDETVHCWGVDNSILRSIVTLVTAQKWVVDIVDIQVALIHSYKWLSMKYGTNIGGWVTSMCACCWHHIVVELVLISSLFLPFASLLIVYFFLILHWNDILILLL